MTSKAVIVLCLAILPIFGCQGQGSNSTKLGRVVVAEALRNPVLSPQSLVGKTFDARKEKYTSLGKDPRGVYFPYVFDEDHSDICVIILARRLNEAELTLLSAGIQKGDDLIVDAFVIHKKKAFVLTDHLLKRSPDGKRWEGIDNMFGISEYNKRQEIVFDRYVVPDFMFRFGDGSDKIERVTNFNGRVFRDSSFR